MNNLLEQIYKLGIIPVIKIDDVEKAIPLAKSLIDGNLSCAEITFRTSQGEEAIRRISKEFPQMLVGAGTVLTVEQVDRAVDAGAKFIVSPGINKKVVEHCINNNILIVPGCSNPTDIEVALELGLEAVKFFPAEQAGGLDYIKAISAPYTNIKFMPTGGINISNINNYLSFNKVIACGGSWMVKSELINEGSFIEITNLVKQAIATMLGFEFAHIGINMENENDALKSAGLLQKMFNFNVKNGNSSVFSSEFLEFTKTPYLGKNGHIAISTNSIERAIYYLGLEGFEFNYKASKTDSSGKYKSIYFKDEIAGFAVHLIQKKK